MLQPGLVVEERRRGSPQALGCLPAAEEFPAEALAGEEADQAPVAVLGVFPAADAETVPVVAEAPGEEHQGAAHGFASRRIQTKTAQIIQGAIPNGGVGRIGTLRSSARSCLSVFMPGDIGDGIGNVLHF